MAPYQGGQRKSRIRKVHRGKRKKREGIFQRKKKEILIGGLGGKIIRGI